MRGKKIDSPKKKKADNPKRLSYFILKQCYDLHKVLIEKNRLIFLIKMGNKREVIYV